MKFKEVTRTLSRHKDKQYPHTRKGMDTDGAIRKSLKNPKIFNEYGKTLDKQYSLYIDSVINKKKNYAFHVFASLSNVKLIKKHIPPKERRYLADGTFKIVPRRFRKKGQAFILSIEYKNDVCCSRIIEFQFIYFEDNVLYTKTLLDLSSVLCFDDETNYGNL